MMSIPSTCYYTSLRSVTYVLVSVLLVGLSACKGAVDGPGAETSDVVVQDSASAFRTDALAYTLRATSAGLEGEIPFVFTNPTEGPVYIVNCNGSTSLQLEKLVEGNWVEAWSPAIPQCLSTPIVVQPGEEYRDTVRVFGGRPSTNVYPKFDVAEIPGVYRLVWSDVLRSYDDRSYPFGEALPAEQRTSNRFALTLER